MPARKMHCYFGMRLRKSRLEGWDAAGLHQRIIARRAGKEGGRY